MSESENEIEVLRSKSARHAAIADILGQSRVGSQAELRELLTARGLETVQATLSRDLAELGASKTRDVDGTYFYAVGEHLPGRNPTAVEPGAEKLARWCQELLISAECAQNLLVLRTPAGAANLLSAAVDSARLPGVIGTVAGDDTILVACAGVAEAKRARRVLIEQASTDR